VQESRVREIRTHGSTGRGAETGSRPRLNGHEAGNCGYRQVRAYGIPRRPPTLPIKLREVAYPALFGATA